MESALGTVCKQYAGQQNATAVSLLAHVQGCLLSLVAIAGIDLFLRYATLKEYKTHSKARWFMLHSLVNFLVAGFSFHDTIMVPSTHMLHVNPIAVLGPIVFGILITYIITLLIL